MACLSAVIVLLAKNTLDQETTRTLAELSHASCSPNTTQGYLRALLLRAPPPEMIGNRSSKQLTVDTEI